MSQVANQASAYLLFQEYEGTMSISTPPWMGCLSFAELPPAGSLVSIETLGGKHLVQEHKKMPPARSRNWTAQSRGKRSNQQATTPPLSNPGGVEIFPVTSCH